MTEKPSKSRDRVLASISHREPDRIPIDYWAVDSVTDRLAEHFGVPDKEHVLRQLNVDLRYVMGPGLSGQQMRVHKDGATEDHWGVLRKPMTVDGVDRTGRTWSWTYKHLHKAPLSAFQSVKEIEAYGGWPRADQWDYSNVRADCLKARETGCAVVNGGDRLDRMAQFKPAMYIRGAEAFLEDLILRPDVAACIIEHIATYYLDYSQRTFEAADGHIDIFFMGDDMGTQDGPWVSVDMYRKFFKENFRKYNDLAHRYGIKTMYHTCGNVIDLIPEFIDCGLDMLQSLQPAAMDLSRLKREYGKDLAFQGGIDIQNTMPKGSPNDIVQEVQSRAQTLGPGGGYIFGTAHNLLPEVPTENIIALFESYLEFGQYG